MKVYAQLNENNICIGISQLTSEEDKPDLILIDSPNIDYMWRKYENGVWSQEKYEPQSTAPLTEFEKVKQDLALTQQALDELILGGAL